MVATAQAVCDYIYNDLITSVTGLTDATPHLYVSWSLEALASKARERHIAVYIDAEDVTEFATNSRNLLQRYEVLVWEDSTAAGAKRQDDDAADLAWIVLWEAVRARFFVTAFWQLGQMATIESARYVGSSFEGTASLRVMKLSVEVTVQDLYT